MEVAIKRFVFYSSKTNNKNKSRLFALTLILYYVSLITKEEDRKSFAKLFELLIGNLDALIGKNIRNHHYASLITITRHTLLFAYKSGESPLSKCQRKNL